jgi:hypothetical protein
MDEEARAAGPELGETDSSDDDGSGAKATSSPEEIRADIEQTRKELGDTVEALAEKTDVKGQAKQQIAEIKGNLQHQRDGLTTKARKNPVPVALGGAVVAGYVLWRLTARRS